ncbi:MAG: ATP-binding protein [Bacteroidota bacterium]
MHNPLTHLCTLCFVSLLMLGSWDLPGQDRSADERDAWRAIDATISKDNLKRLHGYTDEIDQWPDSTQLSFLHKAHEAASIHEVDALIFDYAGRLGSLYQTKDSLAKSLMYLNESLEYAKTADQKSIALNVLAGLHFVMSDYTSALEYCFQSLDEAKKMDNGTETYPISNISQIYSVQKDFENAIKYLRYSLVFSESLEGMEKNYSLAYDYAYMARYFKELGQMDSCFKYLDLSGKQIEPLKTLNELRFRDACHLFYHISAQVFLDQGNVLETGKAIQKMRLYTAQHLLYTVKVCEARLLILQKQYAPALRILDDLESKSDDYESREKLFELKILCNRKLKNYEAALAIQTELINYQDQKAGENLNRFSAFADVKYETLRKNEEINLLRSKQQNQELTIRNQEIFGYLIASLVLLFAGGIAFLWYRYRNRARLNQVLQEQVALKTRDLQQANEELRVLNFVASHDIKEPIRNVGTYIGLIRRRLPEELKESYTPYFDIIDKSIHQIYLLVEDIAKFLSLSKDAIPEKEMVSMDALTNDLFASFSTLATERNVQLTNHGLPDMLTNASLMQVMLKNLIENGIKFNEADPPRIDISYQDAGDFHQVIVADNGIGINEAYFEKIFGSFQRLHHPSEYGGTGIGLAIVKLLSEKLGGSVLVESEPEVGSRFFVNIPK